MSSNNQSIRVSVRFRPMNTIESEKAGNHVCVKISGCGRACQVVDPKHPEKPITRHFDHIYGPGSTQEELYNYTGKPLVEAMKEGFNATIFAYGQTGSGKTWTMIGIPANEKQRGLQPRVIDDVFNYIEEQQAEEACEDVFNVHISMVEIYLEKINDLFNLEKGTNLKVHLRKDGVHIQGVREIECHTARAVMDEMNRGFDNRATSETKMNKESSRSHCITILKVTRTRPDGTTVVSKLKMVDLAGSEKTKKTEAVGQRLREAQAINTSLTALNQVLNQLTGLNKKVKFAPFRDSKLTQLLQDSLGGNAKTSLIVAASPCSFNVEETISSLRFGEAAKKVKCKAVINQDRTIADYQRENRKLAKENGVLVYQNGMLSAREAALLGLLSNKGYATEGQQAMQAAEAALQVDDDQKAPEDQPVGAFEAVSAKVLVINKADGSVEAGDEAALLAESLSAKRELKKREQEGAAAENARLAALAAELIRQGNYAGLSEVLAGKVQIGGQAARPSRDLLDKLADLRLELQERDHDIGRLEDEQQHEIEKCDALEAKMSALEADRAENAFYKRKAEFLEKQYELHLSSGDKPAEEPALSAEPLDLDMGFLAQIRDEGARAQVMKLVAHAQRKDAMLQRLRAGGAQFDPEAILASLRGGGDQHEVLHNLLRSHKAALITVKESSTQNAQLRRKLAMLLKRDGYNKQLHHNWKRQMAQMEQAILLSSQIQKRDSGKLSHEIQKKDEQIQKLKAYIATLTGLRAPKPSLFGPGRISQIKPPSRGGRPVRKKRRPAKAMPAQAQVSAIAAPLSPRS